jgi:peptidoglycan pentaglycine glycine transferase (the second and third glycine)
MILIVMIGGNLMKFEILSEDEYNNFFDNHEQKTFLNSPNIGKIRKLEGWNYEFVGVKDVDNKIIGVTMLLSRKEFLGKKEFYAIRGFLLDYNNFKLLSFFTDNIKKYI